MFRNFLKLRPKKFLGIDIGTSFIRVVELKRKGNNPYLENYGDLGISSASKEKDFRVFDGENLLLSEKDIAQTLQSIFLEAGIETREANFSIPDFCTFFTNFELPVMAKEEVEQAVKYEVRPYVPLPLSEITLDWIITAGETSKTPLKILAVAIPNDVISQYQEIANLSGARLKFLEPEAFALARILQKNINGEKETKVISLIDIGARSTTCSIIDNGTLRRSYSFNLAGNELTEVLARSLNLEYNKAEELKIKYGLLNPNNNQNTRNILLPLINSILEEIKKVFREFYQEEGKETEKVVLAGGLALLPGLKEYFSAELKKEVVAVDPFANFSYPPVLEQVLKTRGPSYAVAVGAALKGFE